jgi:two-component system, LytTR family, sensor kinase
MSGSESSRSGPELSRSGRVRNGLLILLVWTVAGLYFSTQDLTRKVLWGDPTPWWHFLVSWLLGVYLYALLTPLVLWLGARFPLERRVWLRRTALHLAASVVLAIVHLLVEAAILARLPILPSLKPHTFGVAVFVLFVLGFHPNVITYWLILGIQLALRTYRRYEERQREALRLELHAAELRGQLVEAQLSGLKTQLQPHFLFNTLNAIMVLVRQGRAAQAEEMLARLGDLLRSVLDDAAAQEVPLRRELDLAALYLAIEQVRFQDRLKVAIDAAPAVLDAAFPHLGLQPIVENAVRHGIGRRAAAGRIEIRAARSGDLLEVEVRDDGPGLTGGGGGGGIGLANTRARLRQLYGEAASLSLEDGPRGGAVARIAVPFRRAPEVAATEAIELCS